MQKHTAATILPFRIKTYSQSHKQTGENAMDDIIFRKAAIQDIPALIELRILQLLEEGAEPVIDLHNPLLDYYERHMADGSFISWVAEIYGKIIAVSGMSFTEKPPYYTNPTGKIGLLSSMYTLKAFRRKGLSKKLLHAVMNEANAYGCGSVYITASNMGAQLYENCGFKRNGNFFQFNFEKR